MRHLFGTLMLLASSALAGTTDVKLLIDTDKNASTGCRVVTSGGNFDGCELIVTTTFDNTTMTVTGVTAQQCLDPATASFSSPTSIDAGGWRVGTSGGNQTLETHVPAAQVGGLHSMRLGFVVSSGMLTDALLQQPNGSPILFLPAVQRPGRPHVVSPPGGRLITLDGDASEWEGIAPLVNGSSSGTPALRFQSIRATDTVNDFFFLIGIQANRDAPTARDDSYSVQRGGTLNVGPPGVLANDTDPNGKPLTAIQLSGPQHGVLSLNANGGFSYSNDGSVAPVDGFNYKANNGTDDSNAAHVTLTILSGTPPAITSPPTATFTVGTFGSFTVTATGNPTPTLSESGPLPTGVNFNAATGVLSGTPAVGTGGAYSITFSAANSAGTAFQSFTLNVNEGPAITTAAANQTVCAGATATFSAAASGFPAPTVQWQLSTNGGVTFTNIVGATAGTYSFVANAADNNNQYRAVFTNPLGTANTTATLKVNAAPAVTTQPTNQTVCAPANATFTAAASGVPAPTVQWQVSSDGGVTFTNVVGATNTTYTFATAAADNGKQYRAAFTNTCSTVNSNSATLTVNTASAVTTNPASQTVCNNAIATFTAAASGSPAPTVQWQVSTDNGVTFNNLPGATATTLSFMATAADNAKQYRAVFTNVCNTANSAAATLTVNTPPSVTTQPANQTVCAPANATFTAAAAGTPAPTVQWQVSSDGGVTFTNVVGATSTTYTFATVAADNGKRYRATFTNSCSAVNTNSATLTVNTAAAVTTNPASQTVCNNTTATFTAAASGSPAPTVQWQVSTDNGVTFNNLPGATATTLSFMATTADNAKQYRAVFTNVCNTATSTAATLTATTVPVVTTNPVNQTICAPAPVTFTAATSSPATTVQWQLSTDGGVTFNNILGATSTTLTFPTAPADNNHQYRAVFTNICGTTNTTAATLTVNVAPAVTTQPVNQTVCTGATATFTAAASGTPAPTVQWQVSTGGPFANIPGETTTTLNVVTTPADNGKQYRAVFTNSCAVVNSNAATLTVNTPPVVTTNPATQTICAGNMATFTVAATGQPVPSVQWQLSIDGGATFNPIGGATLTTYSFIAAPTDNNHQYRAVLTNACGTATSTAATLTVNVAPAVTTQPISQTVCAGLPVTFTSAASGTPAPTIQWQVSTNGGMSFADIIGATGPSYTHDTVPADNGKQYRAVFTNSCGIANSSAATLTLNFPPVVTTDPATQAVCNGGMATFTAAASGSPAPTVQWQLSTDGGATFNDIGGATLTTYAFTVTPADNLHQFRAVFTNLCNTATTAAATLTVDQTIAITTQPTDQSVTANNPVTFTSAATNFTSVQWKVSTDGGLNFSNVLGATSPTLTYSPPLSDNGKKFKATYTNSCGSVDTNVVTLTVTCPAITVARTGGGSFPAGTINTAYVGQSVTASGGTAPYTFAVTLGALPTGLSLASGGAISGTPTATGTFGFTVTATDANLCTGSQAFTIAINPSAVADAYSNLINNTEAVVTGGATGSPATPFVPLTGSIIANDLPSGGVAVVAGTVSSANGTNNVVIAADGTFKFTPPVTPAPLATDTFNYTISSNTGATATPTLATGTVTLNLSGRVWYVQNNVANGIGQSQSPFNSLSSFTSARATPDAAGDIIFVYTGDGSTTNQNAGVLLLNNEQLIGQGVALVVNAFTLVPAGAKPQITNATPASDGVTLADGNTIKGVIITGATRDGIAGSGHAGFTADTLTIQNNIASGLHLTNMTGTVTVTNATIANNATGLDVNNGTATIILGNTNSITANAGQRSVSIQNRSGPNNITVGAGITDNGTGILVNNNSAGLIVFNGNQTLNTTTNTAVALTTNSGANIIFGGTLAITTTTGSGFTASGGGTLDVFGTANITTGAAANGLSLNGMTVGGSGVTFNDVTTTGVTTGIALTNVNGTVSVNGGAIDYATTGISLAGASTSLNLTNQIISGPGTGISGTPNFGTLNVSGGGVQVSGATALNLTSGAVTGQFQSVNSTGGTNGVNLSGVTGTWSAGGGTLTGASGSTFNVTGGGVGTITWGGFITQSNGANVVTIASGNTNTITFNGNVQTSGTSTGVNISGSGGTYNFNGATTIAGSGGGITIGSGEAGAITFSSGTTNTTSGTPLLVTGPVTAAITYNGTINKTSAGRMIDITGLNSPGTLSMVHAPVASGNFTLNSAGATGISIVNSSSTSISIQNASVTYASAGPAFTASGNNNAIINLAGFIVVGTGTQPGMLISGGGVGGSITLSNSAASSSINVSGGSGRAIDGTTSSFTGTLLLGNVTITGNATSDIVTLTGGSLSGVNSNISGPQRALVLSGVSLVNGAGMTSVTSSGGANGISLTNVTGGPYTINGGSLTGNTGSSFLVSLGNRTFTYNGSITQNTGALKAVDIQNSTGGTITFGGAVNSTAGGISLLTNTGTTMTFTGSVTLNTAANNAFTATGGGTLNVTGGPNTITTSTGTALNVANTTIGASGLTFQSISANGGSNGIVLNTTGGSGGLTVTGDGVNTSVGGNATGGTIQNMSGANGAIAGSGIYLNNTKNVVLRRMTITGTNLNFGIRGFLVDGFTLEFSTVSGTNGGNNNAFPDDSGEGSIYFGNTVTNGMSTQGTFTKNNISGGAWDNLHIENTTAGTTTITVKGNTFGLNGPLPNGNQSLIIEARNAGTIVNSVVGGSLAGEANTFLGAPGGLANFTGQTGTTMDVQFKNNVMSNSHAGNIVGGGCLTVASQGVMTFVVDSNSMRDADGSTMTLQKASLGTSFTGRVTNNSLGVTGIANSASKSGNGIFLSAAGTGTIGLTITGNSIRNWKGNAAMFFDNTGGSYTANFTIQSNTMAEPGAGSFATLALTNGGNLTSDTVNVCATIGGAGGLKNTITGAAGLADLYLGSSGQNGGHTFNLPGYVGPSNLANVQTFVTGNNTLSGGATVIAYDDNGGAGSFTGVGTSCPTP